MRETWWPDWHGETVVIAASGPSQQREDIELARGRAKVLAINNTWEIAQWADVLYACDNSWWQCQDPGYGQHAIREFGGLLVAGNSHTTQVNRIVHSEVSEAVYGANLGDGGNSAYQAINIAALWGSKRILLTGVDCMKPGEHWHGPHSQNNAPGTNPIANAREETMKKWLKAFGKIAPMLAERGVEVVNCSRQTALTTFPAAGLENAL